MSDRKFYCSHCNSRLKIDPSMLKMNSAQTRLLLEKNKQIAVGDPLEVSIAEESIIPEERLKFYREVTLNNNVPLHTSQSGDDAEKSDAVSSFVMLPGEKDVESLIEEQSEEHYVTIAARLRNLQKIFLILSSNSQVDHPLCLDCSKLLLENFKQKFDQNQKEKEYYLSFLRKLKSKDTSTIPEEELDSKIRQNHERIMTLSKVENEKLEKLQELEKNKMELERRLKELKREETELNNNELSKVMQTRNSLQLDLNQKLEKLEQSKSLYQLNLNHLDKLRKLNIYNHFFHITFDGNDNYGAINQCRIGYKVPWSEINAALGQIALLITFIIKRLGIRLKNYKINPMGSQSQIIKTSSGTQSSESHKTVLNLYSSNDFSLGQLFNFNKLDVSMIALLDILSQIESKLKSIDNEIELPYQIHPKHDLIGGKSIRVTSNAEWTLGCKFMLIDMNWILTYTSAYAKPSYQIN